MGSLLWTALPSECSYITSSNHIATCPSPWDPCYEQPCLQSVLTSLLPITLLHGLLHGIPVMNSPAFRVFLHHFFQPHCYMAFSMGSLLWTALPSECSYITSSNHIATWPSPWDPCYEQPCLQSVLTSLLPTTLLHGLLHGILVMNSPAFRVFLLEVVNNLGVYLLAEDLWSTMQFPLLPTTYINKSIIFFIPLSHSLYVHIIFLCILSYD